MDAWQFAGGSVIGRSHRMNGPNNQDAWQLTVTESTTIAIVADGCGSARHSEVGAQIGVQLLAGLLLEQVRGGGSPQWAHLQSAFTSQLDVLARRFATPYRMAVEKFFLFTLVGMVMNHDSTTFFACGDGVIAVNGQVIVLGPFDGNMPPYIGYRLIPELVQIDPAQVVIQPVVELPTAELNSLLVGSDGVAELHAAASHARPGLNRPVGQLDQFWNDDRYFRGNPELVSRELRIIGRDWPVTNPEAGVLPDDTTLIVGRRLPDS